MKGPIVIVEYDPEWPIKYEEEKARVLEAAGRMILAIDHFGSTAVPELGAKPIIDIMAGVNNSQDADQALPSLARIGYTDVTPQPEEPDWFYCLGKGPHSIGYHLHLMRYPSGFWDRHILFRDLLRADPEVAKEYCALKKSLALKFKEDRLAYCDGKTEFIESVIARAQQNGQG